MNNRQFQVEMIKIQNIIKKLDFDRAVQRLHQLIAQVLEHGTDEMKSAVHAIEVQIQRLIDNGAKYQIID